MENKKTEEFAKSILSNSKLDLENPDFNKIVMNKVRYENRKRAFLYNFKYYSLIFIGIDILIIALLSLFNIKITNIPVKLGNPIFTSNSIQLVLMYFTLLIAAILLIKSISGNGYIHSKTQQIQQ